MRPSLNSVGNFNKAINNSIYIFTGIILLIIVIALVFRSIPDSKEPDIEFSEKHPWFIPESIQYLISRMNESFDTINKEYAEELMEANPGLSESEALEKVKSSDSYIFTLQKINEMTEALQNKRW